MSNKLIILTVMAMLLATTFAGVSVFGYSAAPASTASCTATPHISSVTKITSLTSEKITITGTNFCSTPPAWDPAGPNSWLSYDGKGCGTASAPSIQVTDTTT